MADGMGTCPVYACMVGQQLPRRCVLEVPAQEVCLWTSDHACPCLLQADTCANPLLHHPPLLPTFPQAPLVLDCGSAWTDTELPDLLPAHSHRLIGGIGESAQAGGGAYEMTSLSPGSSSVCQSEMI